MQAHGTSTKWPSLVLLPEIPSSWWAVRVPPEVAPATRSTHTGRKAVALAQHAAPSSNDVVSVSPPRTMAAYHSSGKDVGIVRGRCMDNAASG